MPVVRGPVEAFSRGRVRNLMTDLNVAACSHDAAEYAVTRWHYSRILPTGKLVKYGVWEYGVFIGAVIYSRGASPHLGKALGADATEICELTRVALRSHIFPVSKIVAGSLRLLRASNPGLRAVVSFADPKEGHHGGIYQAGNWVYTGMSAPVTEYFIGNRWRHTRGSWHHPDRKKAESRTAPGKHRYVYPLDRAMRRKVEKMSKPYPLADEGSTVSRDATRAEVQVRPLPSARKQNA